MTATQHSGRRREDTGHTSLALYRLGAQFVIPLLPGHNYPMTGRDITLVGDHYPGSGRRQVPGAVMDTSSIHSMYQFSNKSVCENNLVSMFNCSLFWWYDLQICNVLKYIPSIAFDLLSRLQISGPILIQSAAWIVTIEKFCIVTFRVHWHWSPPSSRQRRFCGKTIKSARIDTDSHPQIIEWQQTYMMMTCRCCAGGLFFVSEIPWLAWWRPCRAS